VTFVLPYAGLVGGIRVVAIYAERLQRRGHEVFVVSTPQRRRTLREKVRGLVRGEPRNGRHASGADYFAGTQVKHLVLESDRPVTDADVPDADVVVATWWRTAEWVAELSPSKGSKAYFLQHDEVHNMSQPADRIRATWRLPMRKIVVAQWLADIAAESFGDHDVSVVPNAVDLEQFNAPPRGKQTTPTVGVMYSTKPFKGCDLSLAAFERIRRMRGDLKLVAFGSESPFEELPLPEDADFVLRPAQDEIRHIYASCDAWLFGSRTEGFGLPLLEAMACRTPVVATPAGAAPELLSQGGGVLVKQDDAEDMANGIERICSMTQSEWKTMSDQAYAIATRYTWEDATNRMAAALEKTASQVPACGTRVKEGATCGQ
jgi:glycosyltransferase involved in cell wall biosynthesis